MGDPYKTATDHLWSFSLSQVCHFQQFLWTHILQESWIRRYRIYIRSRFLPFLLLVTFTNSNPGNQQWHLGGHRYARHGSI
jgi:hypothetical protein